MDTSLNELEARGKLLRQLRRGLGWTQRDLAKRAGVSHGEIGRIERGEGKNVGHDTIAAIADAFGQPESIFRTAKAPSTEVVPSVQPDLPPPADEALIMVELMLLKARLKPEQWRQASMDLRRDIRSYDAQHDSPGNASGKGRTG